MKKSVKDETCRGRIEQISLNIVSDDRGVLMPFDFSALPFTPRRAFLIDQVPPGVDRGGHAHVNGAQFFICLRGGVEVKCYMGDTVEKFLLQPKKSGLLVGAEIISAQRFLDEHSLLMVFASTVFRQVEYFSPDGCSGS